MGKELLIDKPSYFDDNKRIDWLQAHKGKFSASRFSDLMTPGKTPKGSATPNLYSDAGYTYIEEMAIEEYTAFDPTERLLSRSMKDGLLQEPECYQHLVKVTGLTGLTYHGEGDPVFIPYTKDSGFSPDSCLYKPDGSISMGAEFKCPQKKAHWGYLKNIKKGSDLYEYDFEYWCQVQFTMMGANTDVWLWGSYQPFFPIQHRILIIEVKADKAFQAKANIRLKNAEKMKWDFIEQIKGM